MLKSNQNFVRACESRRRLARRLQPYNSIVLISSSVEADPVCMYRHGVRCRLWAAIIPASLPAAGPLIRSVMEPASPAAWADGCRRFPSPCRSARGGRWVAPGGISLTGSASAQSRSPSVRIATQQRQSPPRSWLRSPSRHTDAESQTARRDRRHCERRSTFAHTHARARAHSRGVTTARAPHTAAPHKASAARPAGGASCQLSVDCHLPAEMTGGGVGGERSDRRDGGWDRWRGRRARDGPDETTASERRDKAVFAGDTQAGFRRTRNAHCVMLIAHRIDLRRSGCM